MPTENRSSNTEQMVPAAPGALAESIADVEAWLADDSDPGSISITQRESIDLVLYELRRLRLPSIEQRPEDAQALTEQHAAFIGLDEDLMMSQAADFQDAAYALGFSRGRSLLAAQHPEYLSLGGQLARAATQLISAMDDETESWNESMVLKQALENWSMGKPAAQHQGEPVAWCIDRDEPGHLGGYCSAAMKARGVGFQGHTKPLYTHPDAGEVERLHNGHVKSLEALNQQTEKQRAHWMAECKTLRAQLAERDSLLRKVQETLQREYWDQYAGLDETRDLIDAALSASAEPGAPPEQSEWRPLTAPGQIQEGDRLSFRVGSSFICARARQIIASGTDKEEVVYNRKKNHYFLTSMAVDGTSSHKNVMVARVAA